VMGFDLLKKRLEKEKKHLQDELRRLEASSYERREGSPFGKREEEADAVSELEKKIAEEKRAKGLLSEIEHALHKFEEGTYGLCDECGEPIDPKRLEAIPQTSLCVDCKGKRDAKGRPKS
jgi:RNA polymerase-binding protein DksA